MCVVCGENFIRKFNGQETCSKYCKQQHHEAVKKKKHYETMQNMQKSDKQKDEDNEFLRTKQEITKEQMKKRGCKYCEELGCKVMGNNRMYHDHHIMFRGLRPNHPSLHKRINIKRLCVYHHEEKHKNKKSNDKDIQERGLDKIFTHKTYGDAGDSDG